ncbi:SusD-like starch-binding protein associating with outer membrane [Leeuwenhoekiella polynyae]|uniref:SusD-like starch-binding protein associating with outer membrane n=2 Tax=Leeuwenhoekiella polynyae TaxID=1550906 RepID=A0A4Q0PFP8_9FLAO|nr:SusD-like starch-binding protein associating with outer membrane [Leeuwenhoekiella polynyae]
MIMKKHSLYILFLLISVAFVSCDDYVDIKTEGRLYPEETENYRYLLNQTAIFDASYSLVDVASDDIGMRENYSSFFENNYGTSDFYRPFKETYKWGDSIYYTGDTDNDLIVMYEGLYTANVVITEVLTSNNGTEAEKASLQAEALVHRAYVFLDLVNIFGKAYDAETSETDLGIPMFTEPTVTENITRASVKEVYDQIVSDLQQAIAGGLPAKRTGIEVGFPSLASAHALLARTYLYMGLYAEAQAEAESALSLQSSLLNMEDYIDTPDSGWPRRIENPELILSKKSVSSYVYAPSLLTLNDELLNSFEEEDLRYQLYTRPISEMTYDQVSGGRAYCVALLTGETRNAGPTVPELLLIKAEGEARAGDTDAAMTSINTLRQARFKAEDYVPLNAVNADEALVKVLEERRKELMAKGGFRWFDLKRLNKDPRFAKTITHRYVDEIYTLEPGGDRYQFPFASSLFQYAPNLEQNP